MKTVNYLNVEISNEEIIENVNFDCNELFIHSLITKKVGSGHFQLSLQVEVDGEVINFNETTTDSHLIDNMTEDDNEISDEAIKTAVLWVLDRSELENEDY